jgi:hypothetical protein
MKALTWHGKNDIRCETVPDLRASKDGFIKVVMKP